MKATPYRLNTNRSRLKSFAFAVAAILLVIFALPKLPPIQGTAGGFFTAAWLVASLLVIGANLYSFIGADSQKKGASVTLKRSEIAQMRSAASAYRERQYDSR